VKREEILLKTDFYKDIPSTYLRGKFNEFYKHFSNKIGILTDKIADAETIEEKYIIYKESEKELLTKLGKAWTEWTTLKKDLRIKLYNEVKNAGHELKYTQKEFEKKLENTRIEMNDEYIDDEEGYLNIIALQFGPIIEDLLETNEEITQELCAELLFKKLDINGQITREKYFFYMEVKDFYPYLFKEELLDKAFEKSILHQNILDNYIELREKLK